MCIRVRKVSKDNNSEVVYCCNSNIGSEASRALVYKYREPVPMMQKQYDWEHGTIINGGESIPVVCYMCRKETINSRECTLKFSKVKV